ncbi:hypothetical protein RRG08_040331 [Elysia crispata]|uniref:Uncharacterized protein n=1 Tax=Elysia crispata TaxID=231223 RepID=A0AAE1DVZ9_9GAST|nr:hypothetical protein RRG08_040331 [Elysia crispata]
MDHDLPQQPGSSSSSGSSESSNGQRRIGKMFNVSEAQVLLDSIPTDYGTCTDEEPDSDPDDPDFTPLPNPLPSQTRIDRLTVAAEAEDCGTAGDDEENCRPSGRSVLLTKEFRTFQRMKRNNLIKKKSIYKRIMLILEGKNGKENQKWNGFGLGESVVCEMVEDLFGGGHEKVSGPAFVDSGYPSPNR